MRKKLSSEAVIKALQHHLLVSLSLWFCLFVYLKYCLFVGNIKNMR
jgi:hypothetical protein